MKLAKFLALAAVSMVAGLVYADAANTLITFSTKGPDMYADGTTPVVDGEYYALVWSNNGGFDGITTAGEPADAADKVFFIAPLAKDHKCPPVIFQIDSKVAPSDGEYAVYLLDTRDASGKPAGKGSIKGATAAATYGAASGTTVTAAAKTTTDAVTASSTGVAFTADETAKLQPKITGFQIAGDKAIITVSNIQPLMAYEVTGGKSVSDKGALTSDVTISGTTATFNVDKKDATFFSIKTK